VDISVNNWIFNSD